MGSIRDSINIRPDAGTGTAMSDVPTPAPPASDPAPSDASGRGALRQIRHFAKQSALLLTSGVVGYAGGLVLNVMLARILGARGFGTWVVALAFGQTLSTLGLVGADWILLRQGSYYHGVGDWKRLRRTIHLSLALSGTALVVMGIGLAVAAPTIARTVFHTASITPLLRLAGLLGPIMGVGQTMLYGTQAFKRMRDIALIRNVLQPFARVTLVGLALVVSSSPFAGFVGLILAEAVLTTVSTIALNRRLRLFGPTEGIERRELVKFAAPIWGIRLMETSRALLFPILLGSLATLTASGVFVASRRLTVVASAVIVAMNQVYSPMGSNLYLQGRKEELAELFKSMGKWSFALGWPLFCLQVVFPKELLSLFGGAYREESLALILMAISMLFNFATGPVTTTLILSGRTRLALVDYIGVLAAEVGVGLWLIPGHGVVGAAIGRVVGGALNGFVPMAQVWWALRIHPYRLDYWKPLAAGVGAAAVARVVVTVAGTGANLTSAALAAAIIGVVYLALLLALGLTEQDKAAVDALVGRVRRRPRQATPPDVS